MKSVFVNGTTPILPLSETLLHSCLSGLAQGVHGVGMNRATSHWLHERNIPYVSFGGPGPWYVGINGAKLMHMGVQALVVQGCQRIALLDAITPSKKFVSEEIDTKVTIFLLTSIVSMFLLTLNCSN